jgi:hypothetical protein
MRKYYSDRLLNYRNQLLLWLMTMSFIYSQAQVSLTATSGVATGTYTTVSQAFDSINTTRHSGDIVLTITANTTEPLVPSALLKPASGGYTSVKIVPQGDRTIGLVNLNAHRGIIQLFGARNVEIDGDDPAVAGVGRNLTIGFYAGTASFNNTAVIRIGSVAAPSDSAANITIKNCKIEGPRTLTTSTSPNYGIVIASNNTVNFLTYGIRNTNILIENNSFIRCYNGIGCYSSSAIPANAFSNIRIRNNQIGITGAANDFVGSMGIDCEGSSTTAAPLVIEGNEIKVGTNTASGFNDNSIGVLLRNGNPSAAIRYNRLTDIMNNNPITGAGGIIAGIWVFGATSTNIDIHNNFIKDVVGARKQTVSQGNANYGFIGSGGSSFKFNHNTVALNLPNYVGTGANTVSASMLVLATLQEFNNNIVVNRNASTNALCISTDNASIVNTLMDKNCYFAPNGGIANTAPTTLAAWQSVTGRDQNSFIENPPFVSANDLHITAGSITRLESNATPSGYAFDIDIQARPNPTDIGADEFAGTPFVAPVILNVNHTPITQSCATATARTVQALFSTLGNGLDSVMVEYTINGGANQYLRMNSVSALGFTRVIPAVTPLNAIVRYRVLAITRLNDTVSSNYFSYNDNTASVALIPTLTSNPPQGCVTSTVQLSYQFLPDPTGFFIPPTVIDTVMQTNITNVKLTTINNTTPATNSLLGTIGNASGVRGAYSNFRNFGTDTVGLGRSYPISFTGTSTANVKLYFAAFVDLNGDGNFTGANEMVFSTVQARTSGTRTENFSLYIPPNARPGKTCIRFMCSHAPIINSFNNILRGEVEDYSIYIRPLETIWKIGAATIGAGNPQNFTITALPSNVYIEMTDSSGCNNASNALSITSSTGSLNVTLTAPVRSCYNVPVLIRASATGGCPPYTYSWSNNASISGPTQVITVLKDTVFLTVTVTDKNGTSYSRIGSILPNNPRLTVPDTTIICNRGIALITATTANTDSAYWYQSATASPFNFDFMGKTYTTPTLNATRDFYVAALRSSSDSVGKMNLSGSTVNTGVMPINAGLVLDVIEPVIIRDCQMYVSGGTGATISIGLVDKYGTIVAQLNDYALTGTPAFPPLTPTRIPLNFAVPTVDTGYRLILLGFTNLTGLTRNTTGQAFPYITPANRPVIVRRAFNIGNQTDGDYLYFYNIRLLKGVCVGEKDTTTAKVTPPRVPQLFEDLKYTLLCKDDTLNIKVKSDTFGDRFVWLKDGNVIQNFAVTPPSDTFPDSFYRVPISKPQDTGLYQVKIFSTKFCTRDTFSREVRVSFHKEPEFVTNLSPINICLKRGTKLSATVKNASIFKWYKDTINIIPGQDTTKSEYTLAGASFANSGVYHVVATDSNKCRDVKSLMVKVTVHDTPRFVTQPIDTVICVGQRYVIKTNPINALTYQWFKDNGIMNNFIKDSLTLFSSKIVDSGSYRLVASSYPGCPDAVSNPAKLVVNPNPLILGFYPSQLKFCEGQKMKLEARALNKQEIQWYRNGSLIRINDSVVIPNVGIDSGGKYTFSVKALNKCIDLSSDTIDVKVFNKPTVSGTRPAFTACQDGEFKFGFTSTNGKIYQWYKDGVAIQGKIDSQFYIQFLSERDNGRYHVTVNSDPVCPEVISNNFTIDIKSKPSIQLQPIGKTACMGETVQLVVNASFATGYQWFQDGALVPGATNNLLVLNDLKGSNSGKYWVRVNGIAPWCPSIVSDTATVIHRSGQSNATVSLVSIYNAEEQCTDTANWTYYATRQEPNKYVFAVNKKGNNIIGKVDIVVRPNTFVSVNNTGKEYSATLMLKRFWNYKLDSGVLNNPIDVKFYVNQSELDELDDKKAEIENLYADQLMLENKGVRWFKTKDVPFTNGLLGGIRGNRFYFDSVVFGTYVDGPENGVKYFAFKDVQNIGGGSAVYMFKGGTRYLGSIQNGNVSLQASISPNPNGGVFNLNVVSKTLGTTSILVVNNLGQTVYQADIKLTSLVDNYPISIPNLANGIYQLILSKDDINTSLKLQIEK